MAALPHTVNVPSTFINLFMERKLIGGEIKQMVVCCALDPETQGLLRREPTSPLSCHCLLLRDGLTAAASLPRPSCSSSTMLSSQGEAAGSVEGAREAVVGPRVLASCTCHPGGAGT